MKKINCILPMDFGFYLLERKAFKSCNLKQTVYFKCAETALNNLYTYKNRTTKKYLFDVGYI